MVENTIQAIKETEAKAEAVVREAESKYREILDEAAKKAEAMKSEQIQNMKQKAQSDMEKAKEKGTQDLDSAMSEIRARSGGESCGIGTDLRQRVSIQHGAGIFFKYADTHSVINSGGIGGFHIVVNKLRLEDGLVRSVGHFCQI